MKTKRPMNDISYQIYTGFNTKVNNDIPADIRNNVDVDGDAWTELFLSLRLELITIVSVDIKNRMNRVVKERIEREDK